MPNVVCPAPLREGNPAIRPKRYVGRVQSSFRAARVHKIHPPSMGHLLVRQVRRQRLARDLGDHKGRGYEHELTSNARIVRIEHLADGNGATADSGVA